MNRRTFLTGATTAIGGVVALDQGVRRIRTSETVTVAVYQTDRLTTRLEETGRAASTGQRLANEAVTDILESHFGTSFELVYGSRTVPHEVASLPPTLSTFSEGFGEATGALASWMRYNHQRSSVDSHVLLSSHPELGTGNGIAVPGILPTCCEPIDRYGIAWMAVEQLDRASEPVRQTIAHEIGHTIGLQHSHGTNLGGSISVMLTSSYARRVGRNVFGERVRPGGGRVSELNEKLADRHLRV